MGKSTLDRRVDPEYIAGMGSRFANWGAALWILGFVFAILGIVADAGGTFGLTSMAWFMLAIVFHLAGLSYWLSWALALHLKNAGVGKKE